jgi:serine/threonine protein kinase
MPAPATIDEFLDLVAQSELVDAKSLATYRGSPEFDKPAQLAQALARDGLLTRFQAEQILLGTFRRFLIGRYKILDQLGSGGMAKVYLAEHRTMGHRVAIKVLPLNKAQDQACLERFYREARAIARLDHPNIVRAFDIDQEDHVHFLVMEYVDGTSLMEMVMRHGPLHPQHAAGYLRQAANGLQHAFEHGLVHRDIKPANLLVDRSGVVKILDLGLARFFADEKDDLSQKFNEQVLGTADYLAPEQIEDSHNVGIRADIYSLGATFYFCLTGQPPFTEGTYTQKLLWHQTRKPKAISEFRRDVPVELIAVIDKMMAKAPADRFQTPADVMAAVSALPNGVGAQPMAWETKSSRADTTKRPIAAVTREPVAKRQPLPWVVAVGSLLAAGLSLWVAFHQSHGPTPTGPQPTVPVPPPPQPAIIPQSLMPALVVHCGREKGASEDLLQPGYGYRLLQGKNWDGWVPPATRSYAWCDDNRLRFEVKVPPHTAGVLRLLFVDGDRKGRKQRLLVQGRMIAQIEDFGGPGRQLELPMNAEETKDGTIEVTVDNLSPGKNAVVSIVEWLIPSPAPPAPSR